MAKIKKRFGKSDLLTDQEHKIMGSTIGADYARKPYIPKAVVDGSLSVEECEKLRLEHYQGKNEGGIVSYYNVPGCFGEYTIEPLDTNPKSNTYGQTVRDPILISSDNDGEAEDARETFPHKRSEPRTKLKSELERKVSEITAILAWSGSLFFLSANITGNAIGSQAISNWIGVVFLIVGLVAGFFWVKNKKK